MVASVTNKARNWARNWQQSPDWRVVAVVGIISASLLIAAKVQSGLTVFLAILATYRLSHMIVLESGPKRVFERLRSWVREKYGAPSWQFEGINCILCVSFWTAAGISMMIPPTTIQNYLLTWWGVSGAVLIIQKWMGR